MSTATPFETEMLMMMRELKSEFSEMKSDVSTLKSDVSTLKSDMSDVKGRLTTMEAWNEKAFMAIEDLADEVKTEGAATRTMMYQAYNDIFELRDRIDTVPRSRTSRARPTATA